MKKFKYGFPFQMYNLEHVKSRIDSIPAQSHCFSMKCYDIFKIVSLFQIILVENAKNNEILTIYGLRERDESCCLVKKETSIF
jgi:hypothetical protein